MPKKQMKFFKASEFAAHESDKDAVDYLGQYKARFQLDPRGRVYHVSMGHLGTSNCVKQLKQLPKLISFAIGTRRVEFNWFEEEEFCDLIESQNLQSIVVDKNSIADISSHSLRRLEQCDNIKYLGLFNYGIDDSAIDTFLRMHQLLGLFISGSSASDSRLKELASLKNLRRLNIRDTAASTETIQHLSLNLPRCTIFAPDESIVSRTEPERHRKAS